MSDPLNRSEDEWLPVEPVKNRADLPNPLLLDYVVDADSGEEPLHKVHRVFEAPSWFDGIKFRLQLLVEPPLDRLRAAWAFERRAGLFFLWQPVFFGLGCLLYFNLPREPLAWAFPIAGTVLWVVGWRVSSVRSARACFTLMALVAFGAAFAQWRTARVDTNMLSRSVITDLSVCSKSQLSEGVESDSSYFATNMENFDGLDTLHP